MTTRIRATMFHRLLLINAWSLLLRAGAEPPAGFQKGKLNQAGDTATGSSTTKNQQQRHKRITALKNNRNNPLSSSKSTKEVKSSSRLALVAQRSTGPQNLLSSQESYNKRLPQQQHNTAKRKTKKRKKKNTKKRRRQNMAVVKCTTKNLDTTTKTRTPTDIAAVPSSPSSSSTKKLRLQREWKDTVEAGMGFDWIKGRPVIRRRTNNSDDQQQTTTTNVATVEVEQTTTSSSSSCIWLGPIQSMDRWHFSFTGIGDPYEHGLYHGVVILPHDYPYRPPQIQIWTDNGRFHTHRDLCFDVISNYHPESWQPATVSIRSIVESVRLHMQTPADSAIGSYAAPYDRRRSYALASRQYVHRIIRRRQQAAGTGGGTTGTTNGGRVIVIDHGKMIRNGWVSGIQYDPAAAEEDYHDDETDRDAIARELAFSSTSSSTAMLVLLKDIFFQKPFRLVVVGTVLVLLLLLHSNNIK